VLKVSTPKIESMLDAALDAGALGGKINGSGGGGSCLPTHPTIQKQLLKLLKKQVENPISCERTRGRL